MKRVHNTNTIVNSIITIIIMRYGVDDGVRCVANPFLNLCKNKHMSTSRFRLMYSTNTVAHRSRPVPRSTANANFSLINLQNYKLVDWQIIYANTARSTLPSKETHPTVPRSIFPVVRLYVLVSAHFAAVPFRRRRCRCRCRIMFFPIRDSYFFFAIVRGLNVVCWAYAPAASLSECRVLCWTVRCTRSLSPSHNTPCLSARP